MRKVTMTVPLRVSRASPAQQVFGCPESGGTSAMTPPETLTTKAQPKLTAEMKKATGGLKLLRSACIPEDFPPSQTEKVT
jgi:hypothetical protein